MTWIWLWHASFLQNTCATNTPKLVRVRASVWHWPISPDIIFVLESEGLHLSNLCKKMMIWTFNWNVFTCWTCYNNISLPYLIGLFLVKLPFAFEKIQNIFFFHFLYVFFLNVFHWLNHSDTDNDTDVHLCSLSDLKTQRLPRLTLIKPDQLYVWIKPLFCL